MRPINPPTDTTAIPSLIPLCVPFPISIMYGSKFETERAVISATIVSWPPRFSRSNWVRSAANSSTAPSVVTGIQVTRSIAHGEVHFPFRRCLLQKEIPKRLLLGQNCACDISEWLDDSCRSFSKVC